MGKDGFDAGRAKLLVDEISSNLAALPGEGAKYAELRAEVDALKALLDRPDAAADAVEERMKAMHGLFDTAGAELRADGIRAGVFLREIGRMLGLD
jgi:hypothetical protein